MSTSVALVETVRSYIDRHSLLEDGSRVVVGASGGPDSMVCLSILRKLGMDVVAAHVNYGLRESADEDEETVRTWCSEQAPPVPFRRYAADPSTGDGRSLQAVAREQRYRFFARVARDTGAEAVAVGHHRDDQAETLLLNLLRGTGPEGLTGMPPSRPMHHDSSICLIRPLLGCRREDIEAYAEKASIPWCVDETNRDPSYRRGRIRTEVLPLLERCHEGATENIARAADLMRDYVRETLTPALSNKFQAALHDEAFGAGIALKISVLETEPAVWGRRLILEALQRCLPEAPRRETVAAEIAGLIGAQPGRHVDLQGGRVWRERAVLRFVPAAEASEPIPPTPLFAGDSVKIPSGQITCTDISERPADLLRSDPTSVFLDADRVSGDLKVRSWADGDRFRPLNLDGTKLVSDVLTEEEVPPHRRASVCVVTDDEGIVWIVGYRMAHRVRIRPDSRAAVRLTYRPRENPAHAY